MLLLTLHPASPTFAFAPGGTCWFITPGQGADQPHSSGRAAGSCCPHTAWLIRLSYNQRAYLLLELSQDSCFLSSQPWARDCPGLCSDPSTTCLSHPGTDFHQGTSQTLGQAGRLCCSRAALLNSTGAANLTVHSDLLPTRTAVSAPIPAPQLHREPRQVLASFLQAGFAPFPTGGEEHGAPAVPCA